MRMSSPDGKVGEGSAYKGESDAVEHALAKKKPSALTYTMTSLRVSPKGWACQP